MPRQNVILAVTPEQHYLIYSASVLRDVLSRNMRLGLEVVELRGQEATPENVMRAVEEHDPAYLVLCGHGREDAVSVECTALLMRAGDANAARMAGRVLHFNSCLTARRLGPSLVSVGAAAFFGSSEEFIFYIGDPPHSTRASMTAFLAEHKVTESLMRGKVGAAVQADRLKAYDDEIGYWMTEGKDHPHAPEIMDMLRVDREIASFMGEEGATATGPSVALPEQLVSLLIGAAPAVGMLGVVMASEVTKYG